MIGGEVYKVYLGGMFIGLLWENVFIRWVWFWGSETSLNGHGIKLSNDLMEASKFNNNLSLSFYIIERLTVSVRDLWLFQIDFSRLGL